jgi:hypothetical protein
MADFAARRRRWHFHLRLRYVTYTRTQEQEEHLCILSPGRKRTEKAVVECHSSFVAHRKKGASHFQPYFSCIYGASQLKSEQPLGSEVRKVMTKVLLHIAEYFISALNHLWHLFVVF